jgi:hypothetical protein
MLMMTKNLGAGHQNSSRLAAAAGAEETKTLSFFSLLFSSILILHHNLNIVLAITNPTKIEHREKTREINQCASTMNAVLAIGDTESSIRWDYFLLLYPMYNDES